MRVVAIIQARMGSSRLPGKILLPLADKPVLQRIVERVWASEAFDDVVVATSTNAIDDVVMERAAEFGAKVIRGSETDVLDRYGVAAVASEADSIMRITGDCPLIDPEILGLMVQRFRAGDVDLVTNCLQRSFPRGLDAELFSREALNKMLVEATEDSHREHVTKFMYDNPDKFRIANLENSVNLSNYRLTLDTEDDFELLRRICETTSEPNDMRLKDVMEIMRVNPDWFSINAHVEQKKM